MNFFNFHTHNKNEEYGIINLFPQENPEIKRKYSIGLHPWYYSIDYIENIKKIKEKIILPNVVAVGETGLDPKSPVNLELQLEIFKEHIEISEFNKKPIIIHCVKYYNELVRFKKIIKPVQAWIIHGFTGKIGLVEELLTHGFYFSVSETLFKNPEKFKKFFDLIPLDKIFFETDDKNYNIEEIYKKAALEFDITCEELQLIIDNNLKNIGIL